MQDALLTRTRSVETQTFTDWSARVLALIDDYVDRHAIVDTRRLAEALAAATRWSGCPRACNVTSHETTTYLRIPLSGLESRNYEALLILWPQGHATPIHDHAGLWGLELVLDGVLEVETYAISPQPTPHLVFRGKSVLGIGDRACFSGADHAHRCRNFSSQQPALTLHVYGGLLNAYRSFHQESPGRWTSAVHQTHRSSALV